jgi:enamine deaminase RidA (YjgF/YER057c/UK114 family)
VAQTARDSYIRIAETLREHCLEIVHERIFGSLSVEPSVMAARHSALRTYAFASDNPVTYIQGNPPWGDGFAGAIIHAVAPNRAEDVWTIMDGKNPCGRGWRRNGLTYLVLQNVQAVGSNQFISKNTKLHPPLNPLPSREGKKEVPSPLEGEGKGEGERIHMDDFLSLSKTTQTRLMLDRAERILRENGASYGDVVKTWFYLSDILDWYAAFNKVRNEKYGEFGIMPGPGDSTLLLPASTGIGADTPSGAAASMDLSAVVENDDMHSPVIKKLSNRKQLDAFRYGAAFSRGAAIEEDDVNIIQISGTAAIDEHGVSLYPGDIRSQINCTLDKIDSLLSQEGGALTDVCAATVFVKRPEYAEVFWEVAVDRGLENFPADCVVADVCREELLFEIDAEAVVEKKGSRKRTI